jgi:hypothetical protein
MRGRKGSVETLAAASLALLLAAGQASAPHGVKPFFIASSDATRFDPAAG